MKRIDILIDAPAPYYTRSTKRSKMSSMTTVNQFIDLEFRGKVNI